MTIYDYESPLSRCSDDIGDCEVFRAAFALKDADPSNERAQEIRNSIASVACSDCTRIYLHDTQDDGEITPAIQRTESSIFASEVIWVEKVES